MDLVVPYVNIFYERMMENMVNIVKLIQPIIIAFVCIIAGCSKEQQAVTIYTSVDRNFAEPVFRNFEEETGIKVLPAYDTEASKTTGMVNRIIEEKNNPRADVFWNGEFAQTILLKEKGALSSYISSSADDIPNKYKDVEGYWTCFGGRARCIIVNTELLDQKDDYPSSLNDFLSDVYPADKIALAYPLFGTTATHSSALFAQLGKEKALDFFEKLNTRGVRIVDGNAVVRDLVADGQLLFGMTDTDDAVGAIKNGKKVAIVFPDQEEGQIGTLVIPNSVAMINNCPHKEEAKKFIDYLLSRKIEKYLIEIGWCQITVRDIHVDFPWFDPGKVKTMDINLEDVFRNIEATKNKLKEIFIR